MSHTLHMDFFQNCIIHLFHSHDLQQILLNNSTEQFLLHQHLVTNQSEFKGKPREFFKCKAENVSKTSSNVIHNFAHSSNVITVTPHELALLAAKNKPYTAVESLIVPHALIAEDKMLDKKKDSKF